MTDEMPKGKKTVSDEQIIQAIEDHDDPVVTASEIAEIFDHTRQWAQSRLESLREDGPVKKKGSKRSVVWWSEGS